MKDRSRDNELYRELRLRSCDQLWQEDVAQFDRATPEKRIERVATVRAVGVVFAESGTLEQKDAARLWLRQLLRDPCEKIRRYAIAALPKIGVGPSEEADLLSLLRSTAVDREKQALGRALEKVGGDATLQEMEQESGTPLAQVEQKVKAALARQFRPSALRMGVPLGKVSGLRIHLHGRRGLEQFVRAELEEASGRPRKFRVLEVRSGLVAVSPLTAFTLADLYQFRCFGTLGFVLGTAGRSREADFVQGLASVITSPLARRIFQTLTEGSIRYRLEFVSKGHQRSLIRLATNRAYELCPEILNDPKSARWVVTVDGAGGHAVELCPKFARDPRWSYRQDDVPAASHPPLAACMARLAGKVENEIVWDPFCGSGLELIERALLGGVRRLFGTDLSPDAVEVARKNFVAANLAIDASFACADFHSAANRLNGLGANSATLIITNPPMGKRVPVANLNQLVRGLFTVAATVLQPGGRLVFANPLRLESPEFCLKLQSRQVIDLGGFDCRLEKYIKVTGRSP